jgi:hypothetical protein
LSFDRFYHELARWYGAPGVRLPETDEGNIPSNELKGGKEAPLGYGPPLAVKQRFRLVDWAIEPSNKAAWVELMNKSNGRMKRNIFEGSLDEFLMADFTYLPFGTLSMNKARRFGFCGFVDTLECIFEMYQEMAKLGLLPPMKVDAANPLI